MLINNKPIPKIAIGTWGWGEGINGSRLIFGTKPKKEDMLKTFDIAYSDGFTLWDTAAIYGFGTAERTLSRATGNRDFVLSAKYTPILPYNPDLIEKSLSSTISKFNGKIPDIYWLHMPVDIKKHLQYLARLQKVGRIGDIGISNFSKLEAISAINIAKSLGTRIAAVQNHYSLIYRKHEFNGLLNLCQNENILFFAYMVLEQGALTGNYTEKNPFPPLSRRGLAFPKSKLKILSPLFDALSNIAKKYEISPAEVNILWSIHKGTIPIIGITSPKNARSLVKLKNIKLEKYDIAILENFAKSIDINTVGFWEKH